MANVLDLQLDALPPRVNCIWASPPCTHYSRARTKAKTPRDLDGSDAFVQKVLDIIDHYGAPDWFMENPESGLLKGREVVAGLPMRVVDYCKYGEHRLETATTPVQTRLPRKQRFQTHGVSPASTFVKYGCSIQPRRTLQHPPSPMR